jgi:hypothetical protein
MKEVCMRRLCSALVSLSVISFSWPVMVLDGKGKTTSHAEGAGLLVVDQDLSLASQTVSLNDGFGWCECDRCQAH